MRAILSYVGQPVSLFRDGRWSEAPGWSGLSRPDIPGLGRRWTSLCETPDLDLLPARFAPAREARFEAGLELAVMHLGLWLLSWPVRQGWIRSLEPLAGPLRKLAGLFAWAGSDRGGMLVEAHGRGEAGQPVTARWGLVADQGAGPNIPAAPAAAFLRGLASGRIGSRGATACVGLLTDADIVAELAHLPIRTRTLQAFPKDRALLRRVMGPAADRLPDPVRRVHAGLAAAHFQGRGRARGSKSLIPRLGRAFLGLPKPGLYADLSVAIVPAGRSELWTRAFGARRFTSRLTSLEATGRFTESLGPLTFVFAPEPTAIGFRWRLEGWRLGPVPLPKALAPRTRAVTFAWNGVYRFRVLVAHPWLGVIFGYAGRLET